jgi:hypothetical protein
MARCSVSSSRFVTLNSSRYSHKNYQSLATWLYHPGGPSSMNLIIVNIKQMNTNTQ